VASFGQCGVFQTSVVLGVELVGEKWRVATNIAIEMCFVVGECLLTGLALAVGRKWRPLLQVVSALTAVPLLYLLFLPESPRWLLSKGK